MITLEEHLKQEIKKKFRSIKAFCLDANIPYMTVSNVIKRGIANSSFATIQRICAGLNMSVQFFLVSYKTKNAQKVDADEFQESLYVAAITTQHFFETNKDASANDIQVALSFWQALNYQLLASKKIDPEYLKYLLDMILKRFLPPIS